MQILISIYGGCKIKYSPQSPVGGGVDGEGGEVGEGGAGVGAGEGSGVGAEVGADPPPFGSKQSQAVQYCVLTLSPQQSPPSQPHSSLLLSSSQ